MGVIEKIIGIHIEGVYVQNLEKKEKYNLVSSNLIEDEFWNYAHIIDKNINLKEVWENIKKDLEKINRRPLMYITSNICDRQLEEQITQGNFEKLYTDVWMIIDDIDSFENYESKIDFELERATEKTKDRFVTAVMQGFSGDNPDDPYEALSDGYRIALEESFGSIDSEYKVIHYLGTYNDEDISTATVVYKDENAIIYNVTTNKKYQKNGVCKKMMSEIMKDLSSIGIKVVCVQTEQGFYTEQVYKKMGFKEIMLGIGYSK